MTVSPSETRIDPERLERIRATRVFWLLFTTSVLTFGAGAAASVLMHPPSGAMVAGCLVVGGVLSVAAGMKAIRSGRIVANTGANGIAESPMAGVLMVLWGLTLSGLAYVAFTGNEVVLFAPKGGPIQGVE